MNERRYFISMTKRAANIQKKKRCFRQERKPSVSHG
jgi:hypothetical protein